MPMYRLKKGQRKQPLSGYTTRVVGGFEVRDYVDIEMEPEEIVDTDEIILDHWVDEGVCERIFTSPFEIEITGGSLDNAFNYDDTSHVIQLGTEIIVDPNEVVEFNSVVIGDVMTEQELNSEIEEEVQTDIETEVETDDIGSEQEEKPVVVEKKKRGRKARK